MRNQIIKIIRPYKKYFCDYCGAKDGRRDRIAEQIADRLVSNGLTILDWIPVEERLPTREDANESESILAIQKDEGYVGRWLWDIVARYPTEFTCWMPLPEPPKEEKDD